MNRPHARRVFPLFAMLLPLVPVIAYGAEPRASLGVAVDGPTLVGQPLLLKLTLKNTGPDGFAYWCGGPDRYPPANSFTAVFADRAGNRRSVRLSNGQYRMGSGGDIPIAPGDTVVFPAAAAPLPAGTWVLESVAGEPSGYFPNPDAAMTVTWPATRAEPGLRLDVRDDAKAADAFAQDLLRRVRADEPFAQHVATEWRVPAVIDAAVRELESDEPAVVCRAVNTITSLRPLPAGLGPIVKRSMSRYLQPELASGDPPTLLASLAATDGSDESLDAVLAYVRFERHLSGEGERSNRLHYLAQFKQHRAESALRGALADPELEVAAAGILSRTRDPAALPILLEVAKFRGHKDRTTAFGGLSYYWDTPAAVAALEAAAADPDTADLVRQSARSALQSARDAKARAERAKANPDAGVDE